MIKRDSADDLPQPGEGRRGEDGHLGYLLRQAANSFTNRAEKSLEDLGLTMPQFAVLTMLAAYPGKSNADLARLAMLTPQTMNVIVANLLKSGLVTRKPHAYHKRIQMIELNEEGKAALEAAKRQVYAVEQALMEGLSGENEAVIRRWLAAIASVE